MRKLLIALFVLVTLSSFSFAGISLKLAGGLGTVTGGDWNKGIDGWNAVVGSATTHTGTFDKFGTGMDLSGELIFNLNDNFGIGVGAGYFQTSTNNQVKYSGLLYSYDVTWNPKVSVIPIVLNLHLTLPIGNSINFHASAGAGYYMGKFDFKNVYDNILIIWENVGTETWTANKGAIGFQGAIGIDFKIASKVYLGIEVGGRYATMKDLTGDYEDIGTTTFITTTSYDTKEKRTLWTVPTTVGTGSYSLVELAATQPAGSSKSNVSLSGFTAKVGLRFDF